MGEAVLNSAEIETLILINRLDTREGFFRVSTSHKAHFNRILKRVGKSNVLNIKEIINGNKTIQWEIKIPVKYLSKTSLGIRKESESFKELKKPKKDKAPAGPEAKFYISTLTTK